MAKNKSAKDFVAGISFRVHKIQAEMMPRTAANAVGIKIIENSKFMSYKL
jgi:hypothetical protein